MKIALNSVASIWRITFLVIALLTGSVTGIAIKAQSPLILFQKENLPSSGIKLAPDPGDPQTPSLGKNLTYSSGPGFPATLKLSSDGTLTGSIAADTHTGRQTYVVLIKDGKTTYASHLTLDIESRYQVDFATNNESITVLSGADANITVITRGAALAAKGQRLDPWGFLTDDALNYVATSALVNAAQSAFVESYTYPNAAGVSQAATLSVAVVDQDQLPLTELAEQLANGDAGATPAAEEYVPPSVVVGYQQSGANSADSAGRLYINVHFNHPLRFHNPDGAKLDHVRYFGNVQVGSSAQNASSTVGNYVAGLTDTAKNLQLNQIASVAEFLFGGEYVMLPHSTQSSYRFSLFGEYGAQGTLQSSALNTFYAFPAQGTQAYTLLVQAEAAQTPSPSTTIPGTCVVGSSPKITGVANNCMFVEFAQHQSYFDQEAYTGLMFTTYYPGQDTPPGVVSIGFGANNGVNQDMSFNALRIDGFMPFKIPVAEGASKPSIPVLYIFGYANLAIDHHNFPTVNNFIPLAAASSVIANNVVQTQSPDNTYVIRTQPHPQEYYSIGVGVSLKDVWSMLFGSKPKS